MGDQSLHFFDLILCLIPYVCLSVCLSISGHPNDAMIMLSRSPTVICCASTFCLYPALSRGNGIAYLQQTTLLAGGRQPVINDHVQWISTDHVTFTHPGGGKGKINSPEFIKMVVERLTPPSSLKPSLNGYAPPFTIQKMQTASPTVSPTGSHKSLSVVPTNPVNRLISPLGHSDKEPTPTGKEWLIHFLHIYKQHISQVFLFFILPFCLIFFCVYRIIFQ